MHHLICGVTMSGKTTLARMLARYLLSKKQKVVVYDPMGTDTAGGGWGEGAIVFDEIPDFLAYVESDECGAAHVFVDEADLIFSLDQKENHWMLRRGRHFGMTLYCITQRPVLIAPSVRSMCGRAYVFRLVQDDIKRVAADYAFDKAHEISLDAGDFLCFTAGVSTFQRGNVFKMVSSSTS